MLNPIKSKAKKILTNNNDDYDNYVSKVTVVKRELRRPKCVKSNLGFKVSVVEMRNKNLGTRKKSSKKITNKRNEECSVLQKSRNHAFKKIESLPTPSKARSQSPNKLNTPPTSKLRNIYQKYIAGKNSSLMPIKYSEDSKKTKNPSMIFVSLNNMDNEKRHKHKSRKPANASELQRLREKLWKKSSYHKRFLGKSDSIKPKKNKKHNDVTPRRRESLSPKRNNLYLHKSDVRIKANRNKILEQNMIFKLESDENDFDIEEENNRIQKMGSLKSSELVEKDVSMVDKNYIKSLFCIANCNTEQKTLNGKPQYKEALIKNENKTQTLEKEIFTSKKKHKKNNQEFNFNLENSKTEFVSLPDSFDIKSRRNSSKEVGRSTNIIRDAIKSETQLKACKRKTSDTKRKGVKNRQKKAYSKHEINGNQQKTKTRNIRKNKKEGTIEMPLPSEVLKTDVVQELWRRENIGKPQNSQSSDLSVAGPDDHNNDNIKGLGIESYQILKRFVEEEVYRISHKLDRNASEEKESKIKNEVENENQEVGKEQTAILCDKEFTGSPKKKIPKKVKKTKNSFSQDELQLQNAETFNVGKVFQKKKPETAKSKLKLSGEKKSPDEMIKNWSIVNRLEQAFLALGTPDFRNRKLKEPTAINAKGMQTNEKNVTEVKRTEKKEKKSLMPRPIKQKDAETSKSLLNEKQLNVLHKKESTTSNRKLVARSSGHSAKSYKEDSKTKPKEDKARPQPLSSPRPVKPTAKPTAIPALKSGIKPPTKIGLGLQNKVQGSRQIGKFGKKNSGRPDLCESSTQIKTDDDNLERKKTFHIISLKDSIIMQPRRSKSCNKIERNTEVNRVHAASSTGSKECQNLDVLNRHEQNLDFWEFFNKIEKTRAEEELKNKSNKTEQNNMTSGSEKVKSKESVQTNEKTKISVEEESLTVAEEKDSSQESKTEQEVPTEFSKDIGETKVVTNESKVRSIKERSILSIRTSKTENRISHTKIPQTQDKYTPKVTPPKACKKEDVLLPPIPSHSESSLMSTGTYDIPEQGTKSFAKVNAQTVTWNDGLELLKPPSAFSSKSIQIVSSKMSTHEKPEAKTTRNAPWEQDIKQYRALVKEIMSQYKRIDGFLKQSENLKTFKSEELKKPSESGEINNFCEELNIQEYRKKIIMEYQQLPILEYKSKLKEAEEKVPGKRKNLLVVHPASTETDLDVKDYEPSMKTVLGSRLYVDKENLTKRKEDFKNRKEKKLSLQEVALYKSRNEENSKGIVCTPKSCSSYSEQMPHNILTDENPSEKNFSNFEANRFFDFCKSRCVEKENCVSGEKAPSVNGLFKL